MGKDVEKKDESKDVDVLDKLKQELSEKGTAISELTDHLKRLQAEFENYMKRTAKEQSQLIGSATERLMSKLLNVVDDFERAMPLLNHASADVKKGFEMMFKNFVKTLESEGLKKIDASGKFNSATQEVVLKVDSDKPEDVIIEQLQTGYLLNGKVIRYSKVKVSGGNKNV